MKRVEGLPESMGDEAVFLRSVEEYSTVVAELGAVSEEKIHALHDAVQEARVGGIETPPPLTLTILLLGPTGAGKSELLNAMAGRRIARSHYIRPTTTTPTVYAHRDLDQAQFLQHGSAVALLLQQPGALVSHDRAGLRQKIIIDAPDIDSFQTAHRETVLSLLPSVDLVLYVVTPLGYKDDVGWQTVLAERGRRAFAFVMNKWDPEGKPAAQDSRGADEDFHRLIERAGYSRPVLFRTSAKYWVEKRVDEKADSPPAGDRFAELEKWIEDGLTQTEAAQIHQRRRRYLWGKLAAAVQGAAPPDLDYPKWRDRIAEEFVAMNRAVQQNLDRVCAFSAANIAAQRNALIQPFTPGPIGLLLRGFSGVGSGVRGLAALGAGKWGTNQIESTQDSVPALQNVGSPAAAVIGEKIENLELEARRASLPGEPMFADWQAFARNAAEHIAHEFRRRAQELMIEPKRPVGKLFGYTFLWLIEAAAVAAVALAGYRLTVGFYTAQYVTPGFAVNFLALLVCLIILAGVVRSIFFRTSARRIKRDLLRDVLRAWQTDLGKLNESTEATLRRLEDSVDQSKALSRFCLSKSDEAGSRIRTAEEPTTLFA